DQDLQTVWEGQTCWTTASTRTPPPSPRTVVYLQLPTLLAILARLPCRPRISPPFPLPAFRTWVCRPTPRGKSRTCTVAIVVACSVFVRGRTRWPGRARGRCPAATAGAVSDQYNLAAPLRSWSILRLSQRVQRTRSWPHGPVVCTF